MKIKIIALALSLSVLTYSAPVYPENFCGGCGGAVGDPSLLSPKESGQAWRLSQVLYDSPAAPEIMAFVKDKMTVVPPPPPRDDDGSNSAGSDSCMIGAEKNDSTAANIKCEVDWGEYSGLAITAFGKNTGSMEIPKDCLLSYGFFWEDGFLRDKGIYDSSIAAGKDATQALSYALVDNAVTGQVMEGFNNVMRGENKREAAAKQAAKDFNTAREAMTPIAGGLCSGGCNNGSSADNNDGNSDFHQPAANPGILTIER